MFEAVVSAAVRGQCLDFDFSNILKVESDPRPLEKVWQPALQPRLKKLGPINRPGEAVTWIFRQKKAAWSGSGKTAGVEQPEYYCWKVTKR